MLTRQRLMEATPYGQVRELNVAYARLLDLPFDHLLVAHGLPWIGGGKEALCEFAEG